MVGFIFSTVLLVSAPIGSDQAVQAPTTFHTSLAEAAREELMIVERLRGLRVAVEKLPERWSATGLKSMPEGTTLTKPMLLQEIESLELEAAQRWSLLIESAALVDRPTENFGPKANEVKRNLEDLPATHMKINMKLDEFNAKMKDGILLNLATSLVN